MGVLGVLGDIGDRRGSGIAAFALALGAAVLVAGCQTTGVQNVAGTPTNYQDTRTAGLVRGTGIESQDIKSMVDKMVRHMLANPTLAGAAEPPRVIVDSAYFDNQSSQRIDKDLLIGDLASSLHRAANGRILFVNRARADMVEKERALKRAGKTDVGTVGLTRAVAGADYRLSGRITSQDARRRGTEQRYMHILFEMTDLESGIIVWSNEYDFKKAGRQGVVYR